MSTTNIRTQKAALREAINRVIGTGWQELVQVAICLRTLQLQENVLHPDDCCGWGADGSDPEMKQLGEVLHEQGLMQMVDHSARQLMAEMRFARNTLRAIKEAEGDFGSDFATLESWTDAASAIRSKTEVEG